MEIQILTGLEFSRIFGNNCIVYCTNVFSELNRFKVDEVYYLTFRDNKYRLGIILGINGDVAYAPFSAPFGGFLSITGDISVNYITSALNCLRIWLISNNVKSIQITLPPNFYGESFISKQINSFFVQGFVLRSVEINHFFKLSNFDDNYISNLPSNSRRNLNIANLSGFDFIECNELQQIKRAFEIIRLNREQKKYPLRMSEDQMISTLQIIKSKVFILQNKKNEAVASAFIFDSFPGIAQIIYWGSLIEYIGIKPMNKFAFEILKYYNQKSYKYLDIGPSSENSIPNLGLCDFKESIGCESGTKFIFEWIVQ